jgi:hypothetical protein
MLLPVKARFPPTVVLPKAIVVPVADRFLVTLSVEPVFAVIVFAGEAAVPISKRLFENVGIPRESRQGIIK